MYIYRFDLSHLFYIVVLYTIHRSVKSPKIAKEKRPGQLKKSDYFLFTNSVPKSLQNVHRFSTTAYKTAL